MLALLMTSGVFAPVSGEALERDVQRVEIISRELDRIETSSDFRPVVRQKVLPSCDQNKGEQIRPASKRTPTG